MIIIGITGSIGMGKSTVALQFAKLGAKVCKADNLVHALLAKGGKAVGPVSALFPSVEKQGSIDREALGKKVFNDHAALKKLEHILHPMVVRAENDFIEKARAQGAKMAVLDIPLLFETGGELRCNVTICVTAPPSVQRARVLKRKGMTEKKFKAILSRQMPDSEKQKRADFVVHTGLGKAYSMKQVKNIVEQVQCAK